MRVREVVQVKMFKSAVGSRLNEMVNEFLATLGVERIRGIPEITFFAGHHGEYVAIVRYFKMVENIAAGMGDDTQAITAPE